MQVGYMDAGSRLDNRLVRALREGSEALPEDLARLRGYLRLIGGLLAEKANEIEPSWLQACEAAAEIETLHTLELAVAERAIGVRATDIGGVRAKFEIWRALATGDADCDMSAPRNRLIQSIEADLEGLWQTLRN